MSTETKVFSRLYYEHSECTPNSENKYNIIFHQTGSYSIAIDNTDEMSNLLS